MGIHDNGIRWSKVNKAIFTWLRDPGEHTRLERQHRALLKIVKEQGPLNRYELVLLGMREVETSQDIQRIVTDCKRIATNEGCLLVQEPCDFLDENPIDFTGVAFSRNGGYCVIDENGNEYGNWRTADEAIVAKQKRYPHIPQT